MGSESRGPIFVEFFKIGGRRPRRLRRPVPESDVVSSSTRLDLVQWSGMSSLLKTESSTLDK